MTGEAGDNSPASGAAGEAGAGDAGEAGTSSGGTSSGGTSSGGTSSGGTAGGAGKAGGGGNGGGGGQPDPMPGPPTVVSVSPRDQSTAANPSDTIQVSFSEPLDPASVTASSVQIKDACRRIGQRLPELRGRHCYVRAQGAHESARRLHREREHGRDRRWQDRDGAPVRVVLLGAGRRLGQGRVNALQQHVGLTTGSAPWHWRPMVSDASLRSGRKPRTGPTSTSTPLLFTKARAGRHRSRSTSTPR